MGARLVKELYFALFGMLFVASGCFSSYRAGDREREDADTWWDDVSRDAGTADVNDKSEAGVARKDSGRRDSGLRDSGHRDSGHRDGGRRDSGEYRCDSEVLDPLVPITVTGSTSGSSSRLEPPSPCADQGAPERTFVFRPTVEGRYQIDTFGSSFDTVLYVLEGDCRGPVRLCNDDVDVSTQSYVDLWLDAGETVTLVVDGFYTTEQGRFILNINRQDQQCGNGVIDRREQCDGRDLGGVNCYSLGYGGGRLSCNTDCSYNVSMCVVDVTGGTGSSGGTGGSGPTGGSGGQQCDSIDLDSAVPQSVSGNTYSRSDRLEPSCASWGSGERSYLFQAARGGYYTFDTTGSNFDTVLYLLEGDCTGSELVCNDDSHDLQSSVTTFLRAQQLVTVVVDGYGGDVGTFVLNIGYREDAWICGDGVIDSREECDRSDFGGLSCASYGYQLGSLYCNPIECTISTSGCYNLPSGGASGGGGSAGTGSGGSGGDSCASIDLGSTIPQTTSGNTWDSPNVLHPGCVTNDGPERSFTFTASQTRTYIFDTVGSNFDTVLHVRRGDCYGTEIACNDDGDRLLSRVSPFLEAGDTVTIIVDGFASDEGSFVLNINRYENQISCGDGVIQDGEQCDANNLGGATCRSLGYESGSLFCNLTNCRFDVSMCSFSLTVDSGF